MSARDQREGLDIEEVVRPPTDTYRILHVDDDSAWLDLASTFLERDQELFEVVTETSATDGLERLQTKEFDGIISDYDMPEMDGLEFLSNVRNQYPDIPFILFTGKGSEEIASEAISAGVTDYLQKVGVLIAIPSLRIV